MTEYTFYIPVKGTIVTKITADTPDEALNLLINKQEGICYHPHGILEPVLSEMLMYESEK